MNHRLLIILCSLSIALSTPSSAQEWIELLPPQKVQNETLTFYDVQKAFNDYWEPFNVQKGYYKSAGVQTKAGGWKQFRRWEWLMEARINPTTGEFPKTTGYKEFSKLYSGLKAASVSDSWVSLGPASSDGGYAGLGRFNCVAFRQGDNNTLYAGTASGGLWRTTNGGTNWVVLTDENPVLGVSDVIVIPGTSVNSDILYIGTGDRDGGSMWSLLGGQSNDNNSVGVLKSTDGGSSWVSTGLSFSTSNKETVNRLLRDPVNADILYAATTDGFYKTTDAGVSWTKYITTNFIDIEMNPDDSNIIYGSTMNGQVYRSTDYGENWNEVLSVSGGRRTQLAVSPDNANIVYVLVSAGSSFKAIYKSTDKGALFSSHFTGTNMMGWDCDGGSGGQGWYDLCIAADPNNVNTVFVGGVNTWKSTDGGGSWAINNHWSHTCGGSATEVHADKHFLAFQNGSSVLYECNDGGLYKTTDLGASWTQISDGVVCSQIYRLGVSQTSPNDIIIGLQDNGTKAMKSSTWDDVIGGDGMECLIDYTDENVQYGELYYGSIKRTLNKWASYTTISGGITEGGSWVTPFIIDPNDNKTLYAGYSNVWKTTDRGDNWTKISDFAIGVRSLAVAPSNSQYIYAASQSKIYTTSDGGTNWTDITNTLPVGFGNITYVAVKHDDPNTVWVTLGGYNSYGIYESKDAGATWNNISTGLPNIPVMCVIQNRQNTSKVELYVGTDVGIYVKIDDDNWSPFMTDLPNVVVTELDIYYDDADLKNSRIRAATYGRGLWESELYPSDLILGASFTATPVSGVKPLTVNFTDQSTGIITVWNWDFGDGTTSTGQNPSHTYTEVGKYTVKLVVTDATESDSLIKTEYIDVIYPAPDTDFEVSMDSGDVPLNVNFIDKTTGAIDTWNWNFGDGNSSTQQSPTHTYDLPGTYSVQLITAKGIMADTLLKAGLINAQTPAVYAGPDDTICERDPFTVSGSQALDAKTISWTTSGDGEFTAGASTTTPTYKPGPVDVENGTVSLTMTVVKNDDSIENDLLILTILSNPTVDAGDDQTICENENVNLSGTASDYSTVIWTTTGDGSFSDANSLNAIYYPGTADRTSGEANLTLTANAESPCTTNASSNLKVTIKPLPTVNAGANISSCGTDDVQLNGSANNYSVTTISWTGGEGSFSSTSILSPKYTPTTDELAAGTVTLTLTVSGQSPCTESISDNVTLTLRDPQVNAGGDVNGCKDEDLVVENATARDVSVVWTTSGDGTFDDPTSVNPTYRPGTNDYLSPPVTLTMTGTATSPCSGTVVDQMKILSFIERPTVLAGYDTTICQTGTYETIYATTNGEESSVSWSTDGNGSFGGNENQLRATYTPGSVDIQRGYADLTLTAIPNSPCATNIMHTFRLTIQRLPVISAGDNESVCEGSSIELNTASASFYKTLEWTTSGSGTFSSTSVVNPIYNPSAADIVSGVVLTLTATSNSPCSGTVSDAMTLTGVVNPSGNAGSDATICEIDTYYINDAVANDYSSLVWTSSGDGSFSNASIINPTYIPGPNDITNGTVTLELTIIAKSPCTANIVDNLVLTLSAAPVIDAGSDVAICAGNSYTTNATVSNHSDFEWTTSGDGTFVNATSVNNVYTPGPLDINNGQVTLTLTATGITPCDGNFFDNFVLTINEDPTAYAGADEEICETPFTLTNAIAENYSSLRWTSDGSSGTLTNETTLTPTYTASAADIARGYVNLTLTANTITPCTNTATDVIRLDIQPLPTADAGPDAQICETDNSFTVVGASVSNQASYRWSSSGTGTLINSDNNLAPTYTPSTEDIANGSVRLILTANPIAPCGQEVVDEMVLTIKALPQVEVGANGSVCENESFTAVQATASDYNTLTWTTSGDGTFVNPNVLNAVYTPGPTDKINEKFRLTLTATSNTPCTEPVSDYLDVNIIYLPTADAGPDIPQICSGDSFTVSGATASNYSAINWTTSGSGTITNGNTLNPTYIVSENDATLGTVTLTMEVTSIDPCNSIVSDAMLVHITPDVIVDAGDAFSICEGSVINITTATASNYTALSWSSSGNGTFAFGTTLTPTYTPSVEDIEAGSVNLMLTGIGNPECEQKSDNVIITIYKNPTADAGPTKDICSIPTLIEGAVANHYSSLDWTTTGNGTFSNGNTLTPTYTPSVNDVANGTVTLTLTANPINPCATPATSSIILNVHQAPEINAGDDGTVCEGETFSIISASVDHVTDVQWTTSGTGTFADPEIANTVYTPTAEDIALGNVTLTLTGSNASCTDVDDYMVLTIQQMPQVFAGKDTSICENGIFVVSDADIHDYSSLSWIHDGTGTLTNTNTISPIYTAGPGDLAKGKVILTVSATAKTPCSGIVNDVLVLDVKRLPTSYAGVDTMICESENYLVVGATASDYESVSWSSSGSGTFLNIGTLTPTYQPSQEDIDRGSVVLRLHAKTPPCNDVTDQMTLSFALLPVVNAGFDASINFGSSFEINTATISNHNGIKWTTTGTGIFSDDAIIDPVYTPSAQDFSTGYVFLRLTGTGILPCGEAYDEMKLTVSDSPDVDFTWSDDCVNHLIDFEIDRDKTDVDKITSWSWDFGDGTLSNEMEPSHMYNTEGTYKVTLTVVDINNYTNKISHNIEINPLPIPNFEYDAPSCSNLETQFTDFSNTTKGYVTVWHYDFGDGNEQTINFPDNPNVSHQYTNPGVYTVILTVTNSVGCSNSISRDIVVVPSPVANFDMSSFCLSGSATFEDLSQDNSGGNIVRWEWDFGDPESGVDNTSNLQTPTHKYENSGSYEVSLTVYNANGCNNTIKRRFEVTIQPEVDFYFEGSTCINNEKQFFIDTDVVNMINVTSINWDFGDGQFSTQQNPLHIYTETGNYIVTLSIENDGCESSISYPVTVYPGPTSIFSHTNYCAGSPTEFRDRSAQANYPLASWEWDFGDPNRTDDHSTLQNPDYTYAEAGTYTVTMTVTDENGCKHTSQSEITINPSPGSAFSLENNYDDTQGQVKLTNESENALSYYWDFGDGNSSEEENPVHGYTEDGTYIIELVSYNTYNCPDTSRVLYELLFKGLYIPNAFSPNNPNAKLAKFKAIGMNVSSFRIEVYDAWGKLVWESEALDENGSPSEEWDGTFKGSPLPQGVYTWKATAVYKDGSLWDGKDIGKGGNGRTSGTLTLIR